MATPTPAHAVHSGSETRLSPIATPSTSSATPPRREIYIGLPSPPKTPGRKRSPPFAPDTPSPPEKRVKTERSESSTTDLNVVQECKSTTFWYSDGNVVVHVGGTLFKLHRSCLAKHSLYFEQLFSDETSSISYITFEEARVYHGPEQLVLQDFERFLVELYMPSSIITRQDALRLFRASTILLCESVKDTATARLHALWDARAPPPIPSSSDVDDAPSYDLCIYVLSFAREHPVLQPILKRVYYELLSSPAFWATLPPLPAPASSPSSSSASQNPSARVHVEDKRTSKATGLRDHDRIRLLEARHALQCVWRDFVRTAPYTDAATGLSSCPCPQASRVPPKAEKPPSAPGHCMQTRLKVATAARKVGKDKVKVKEDDTAPNACATLSRSRGAFYRPAKWVAFVNTSGAAEDGALDPIRYDLVGRHVGPSKLQRTWCALCLSQWQHEWEAKRAEWWAMLDGWLGLV